MNALIPNAIQVYPWGEIKWLHEPNTARPSGISVARVTVFAGQRQEVHSHPGEEQLVSIISGRGIFVIDGKRKNVEAEMLEYIPPFAVHEVICDGDVPLVFHVVYAPLKISNEVSTTQVLEPLKLVDHISIETLSRLLAQLKTLTGLKVYVLDEMGTAITAKAPPTPSELSSEKLMDIRVLIKVGDTVLGTLVTESFTPMMIKSRIVVINEHLTMMADYLRTRIENQLGEREKERLRDALKSLREQTPFFPYEGSNIEKTPYPLALEKAISAFILNGEGELHALCKGVDHALEWRADAPAVVHELMVVLLRMVNPYKNDAAQWSALREKYLFARPSTEQLKAFIVEVYNSMETLPVVEKVNLYIKQHYSEPLCLKSIAALFYMSPNHLSTQFNLYNGISLSLYIQKTRIEAATHLLHNPRLLVKDVGKQVGFQSVSYFVSAFRAQMGVTPSAFRTMRLGSPADDPSQT